jgi:hypothetical protein
LLLSSASYIVTLRKLMTELNVLLQQRQRLPWSRGNVLAFGTQVRGFKTRSKLSDFSGKKILSTPPFGGEVNSSVPCRALRHVKEPKCDVEVVTFGKILSAISRP